jgi:hypothetical protein
VATAPITFFGLGPVRVGATLEDAAQAAEEPLAEAEEKISGGEGCHHVRRRSQPSVLFMVEDGVITRVETDAPSIPTFSGVRVGDSEERARAVYGSRLEVTTHNYDETGHYLTVRSGDGRYALVMETDGHQIYYLRAGIVPSAEYVEGCL